MRGLAVGTMLLVLLAPLPAQAQGARDESGGPAAAPARRAPRFLVSGVLGGFGGGPEGSLEAAMRDAGYTTPFGGCGFFGCFGPDPSPNSYSHHNPWLLTLAYRLPGRPGGVQLLLGGATAGATMGRSGDGTTTVDHSGNFLAAQLWAGSRVVRASAGPAVAGHEWETYDGSAAARQTTTSLGVVGGLAVTVPVWRALGLEVTAQGRAFRAADYEGKAASGTGGAGAPRVQASVSHWYVGAGPALRFD